MKLYDIETASGAAPIEEDDESPAGTDDVAEP